MGFLKTGALAVGKLITVIALAGAFLVGLLGVIWLSLQGNEVKVPEVVGKDFGESEKELTQLGLKIKRRAFRFSQEKPNTVIEQSPRAGEPVKTGQIIFVVVSQANPESTELPATVNKESVEELDSDEGVTDTPKKTNKNSNVKKPTQTTRDVSANKPAKNSNSNVSSEGNSNNKPPTNGNSTPTLGNKPPTNSKPTPSPSPKPNATKTPTNGDSRTRRVPF